jgi:hypothetical protein
MTSLDGKSLAIIALVLFILYMVFKPKSNSPFTLEGSPIPGSMDAIPSPPVTDQVISSALLPKEVPVSDDFGQFSSDAILANQNYLDPRGQIGYPETIGGTLRNANLQFRSEPANPRDPVSIWNLSTITPELMRPTFEIQDKEYQ